MYSAPCLRGIEKQASKINVDYSVDLIVKLKSGLDNHWKLFSTSLTTGMAGIEVNFVHAIKSKKR